MSRSVGAPFRGHDRRLQPLAAVLPLPRFGALALFGLVVSACLAVAPVLAALPGDLPTPASPVPGDGWIIAAVCAVAGIGASALWLGTWGASGRTCPVYLGLSLVPTWVMAELGAMPATSTVHVAEVTLAAPVTAGVAVLLLARARRSPEVDTTLRPLRTFWVLLLGTTGLVVLGAFAIHSPGAPALPPAVVAVGGATGACLLWLAALLVRVAAARSAMLPELPVGYLALGLGAADRAFGAVVGDPTVASWSVAAGRAVSLVGCILLLVAALRTFRGAQLTALARTRNLRLERDNVVRGLDAQRALLAQDRHDLRSLVAGIQDATTTLTAYRDHLDPDDRQQLETALVAEIQRLRRAVGGEQPVSTFRLATALRPVITLERIRGTAVEADLPDVEVEGSAEAAAAVVQNILANTRRHAPGAVASVHVRVDPDHVRLVVTDDGPGLPDEVRRWAGALFDEPHREPVEAPHRGEGHGLGFAICARLAHDHGMRLELLPAERAGFELSLPLARAVRVGQVA